MPRALIVLLALCAASCQLVSGMFWIECTLIRSANEFSSDQLWNKPTHYIDRSSDHANVDFIASQSATLSSCLMFNLLLLQATSMSHCPNRQVPRCRGTQVLQLVTDLQGCQALSCGKILAINYPNSSFTRFSLWNVKKKSVTILMANKSKQENVYFLQISNLNEHPQSLNDCHIDIDIKS